MLYIYKGQYVAYGWDRGIKDDLDGVRNPTSCHGATDISTWHPLVSTTETKTEVPVPCREPHRP